jgi:succinate dehydrogenase / fumarate reductase, flavoprotein subunit
VFGRRAGRSAAERAKGGGARSFRPQAAQATLDLIASRKERDDINTAAMIGRLQATMADHVGPFRTEEKLKRALGTIEDMTHLLGERPIGGGAFDLRLLEWFDLRNMLIVARTVAMAALARTESRGAHQREDFPGMLPEWRMNQVAQLGQGRQDGGIALIRTPALTPAAAQ